MTDFATELLGYVGEASDAWDIRAILRRCYFYDFDGYPTRLWDGQGVLVDSEGNEWLGTIDAAGENLHTKPAILEPRDGTSPRYEFGLRHLDETSFDALKGDQDLVRDRRLNIYHAVIHATEGLRPTTPLRFAFPMVMKGAKFQEGIREDRGQIIRTYSAQVVCRSLEYGRSKSPGGTYTSTSQAARAALLGVATDSGCDFVAGNSVRTYVFE